ncbi:NADH-quinone oxidoreductase subunit H [Candidatus Micrarchaeota archaeon]|nr:NADH-quinone oxidoreductase subunit H [Candidatus Micrarchaeota archaeon]
MIEFIVTFLLVFVALLFAGFHRKLLARLHNRTGPPVIQPFYDTLKLFSKKKENYENPIFNAVPYVSIIASFAILFIVSSALVGESFDFDYNFIVLGYLFILLDTFYIFGAVASRSPFAIHSGVRELLLMLGYKTTFLMVMSLFFAKTGVVSLGTYSIEFGFLQVPFASILLVLVGFAVMKVTPFDVVNAETEISAGLFAEYYGDHLALLKITEFIKDLSFGLVAGLLLFGKIWALPAAFGFVIFYTLMEATSPRYCTFKAVKVFIIVAILAFIDLFLLV